MSITTDDIKLNAAANTIADALKDEIIETDDLLVLIMAEMRRKGIAGHHIASFNSLCDTGIPQIVKDLFAVKVDKMVNQREKTEEDRALDYISFTVKFTGTRIDRPVFYNEEKTKSQMMLPSLARLKGLSYTGALYVSARVVATATMKDKSTKVVEKDVADIHIGSVPIMIGSAYCYTSGQTRDTLKSMQEDPQDSGGYFIIRGGEWSVNALENLVINSFHVYRNMHANEVARGTFQSKPGDAYENSYYMVVRYLANGALTAMITLNKEKSFEVPFFLLFRAFGITRDDEILNHIVYGIDNTADAVVVRMMTILTRAMRTPLGTPDDKFADLVSPATPSAAADSMNPAVIIERFSNIIYEYTVSDKYKRDDNAVKYVVNNTHDQIDRIFLPHIGVGPAVRVRKLRFFGHLINKLLRVEMGILEGTDRDSLRNKRVLAAGPCLAKAFKAHYNTIVARDIKKRLQRDFRDNSFSAVVIEESLRSAVNARDLEKVMTQSITSGNKTITVRRNETINRVSTQQLYRKNDLHVKSVANTIATTNSSAAKKTERAELMRRFHPSYSGFISPTQSADTGEQVGMSKQMAVTATICEASVSELLKKRLVADPDVMPLDSIRNPGLITAAKLTKIFVNGDWIGCCGAGPALVKKYQALRRSGEIHPFTTIAPEYLVRELYFWCDVGRLIRPLCIVYNNMAEIEAWVAAKKDSKSAKDSKTAAAAPAFRQWTRLTMAHIRGLVAGKITINALREQGILEYITPEEQESLYLAPSILVLQQNSGNITRQWTHFDIEQALLGIVELSTPNANHTPATRNCMATNQKKQANSWAVLNYPYRIDKNLFIQYQCDTTLIRTFADAIIYPNVRNVKILYQVAAWNQEDSAIVSQGAVDRGLFLGSKYYFEKSELDKDEAFGCPDLSKTINIKADANYSVAENGFVREGTMVGKGDVLIIKHSRLPKAEEGNLYDDRSLVYKFAEPAIVEKVVVTKNDEGIFVARVKLRMIRPLQVGDKISSRHGNKSIVAAILPEEDMPYAEDGTVPDIIINSHALPTRMITGQIMETVSSWAAIKKGSLINSNAFIDKDIGAVIDDLAANYGIADGAHVRMFNGRTGIWYDAFMFYGVVGYHRLQKFVFDQSYAMETGPTCALTRQPMDGKAKNGGMRIGEMEKDVYTTHGSLRALHEKFYRDSDGCDIFICRVCGTMPIVNERQNIYRCKICGDLADIARVKSSFSSNLFFNELNGLGVKLKFELEHYIRQ
jgi:DNA-directed RNA polymerase II subunit RPB2